MDFSDKTAVITGGASGIARTTAQHLVKEGLLGLALVDLNPDVTRVSEAINAEAGRDVSTPFVGDVADRAFRRSVFATMGERYPCVNICVPAAGIVRDSLAVRIDRESGELRTYPQEDFESVISVNLTASVFWAIEALASVAAHRSRQGMGAWTPPEDLLGAIIFIGSISSAGNKGQISYAAAKAGLDGAQATLAKESIRYGVRTGIIHPGFTDTPMVHTLGDRYLEEKVLPNTQLKRLLDPNEIADAIVFMIRNPAVSGALWADAGWHPAA
ncbi:MAG: SDR family oxidoreductase [Planctomycetota bacterium]|jgi:NAD(P)-dependent dehydrogenase (short-subunit alcohol dehydrogenase family)